MSSAPMVKARARCSNLWPASCFPDEGWVRLRGGVAPLVNISGGFKNDLTVRDNVYIVAGLHGMTKSQVDETVRRHHRFRRDRRLRRHSVSSPVQRDEDARGVRPDHFDGRANGHHRRDALGGRRTPSARRRTNDWTRCWPAARRCLSFHTAIDNCSVCAPGVCISKRGRLAEDGPIDEILASYTADRESEGHPGWKGERKAARRERRARRREAKRLLAAGEIPRRLTCCWMKKATTCNGS